MPEYGKDTFGGQQFLEQGGCAATLQIYLRDQQEKFMVVFPSHEYGILPYGIFDFANKTLYLDKKAGEKAGTDGIIDEIIQDPKERDVFSDHPTCTPKAEERPKG
jgi:hypothetical protein